MDHYIQDEVAILFSAINQLMEKQPEQKEVGLDIHGILPAVAINTLWYIIAGVKIDLEDESFVRLTKLVLQFFRLGDVTSPVPLYKFLQQIPIVNRDFKQQEAIGDEINNFVKVRHFFMLNWPV